MSDKRHPIVRLHLWLETQDGLFFGLGRAQLLQKVADQGSLRKAAEELGMSYRAAWGKLRKSEEILCFRLIEQSGSKRAGCHLAEDGRKLLENFLRWFEEVETEAVKKAAEMLPWPVVPYAPAAKGDLEGT